MTETLSPAAAYAEIVKEFAGWTSVTWAKSGRCCLDVRDGAPKCCYQIADGEELTFTRREIEILDIGAGVPLASFAHAERGPEFVLNRAQMPPEAILESTWHGWLAKTLECASHPLRPIVIGNKVVAVAAVRDCNTDASIESWSESAVSIRDLWQRAYDLVGTKNYYVRSSFSDEGLRLI